MQPLPTTTMGNNNNHNNNNRNNKDNKEKCCWFPFKETLYHTRRRIKPEQQHQQGQHSYDNDNYQDPPNVYYLKKTKRGVGGKAVQHVVGLYEYDETDSQHDQGATELVLGGFSARSALFKQKKEDTGIVADDFDPTSNTNTKQRTSSLAGINPNCISQEFWVDEIVEGGTWSCLEENVPGRAHRKVLGHANLQRCAPTELAQAQAQADLLGSPPTSPRPKIEVELELEIEMQQRQTSYTNSLIELEQEHEHEHEHEHHQHLEILQLSPVARRVMCGALRRPQNNARRTSSKPRSGQFQDEKKEDDYSHASYSVPNFDHLEQPQPKELPPPTPQLLPKMSLANNPFQLFPTTWAPTNKSFDCGETDNNEAKTDTDTDTIQPHFYVEVEATQQQLNVVRDLSEFETKKSKKENRKRILEQDVEIARTASLMDMDSTFMEASAMGADDSEDDDDEEEESRSEPPQPAQDVANRFEEYRKRWPDIVVAKPPKRSSTTHTRSQLFIPSLLRSSSSSNKQKSAIAAVAQSVQNDNRDPRDAMVRIHSDERDAVVRIRSDDVNLGDTSSYEMKRYKSETASPGRNRSAVGDESLIPATVSAFTEGFVRTFSSLSVKQNMTGKIGRRLRSFGLAQRSELSGDAITDRDHEEVISNSGGNPVNFQKENKQPRSSFDRRMVSELSTNTGGKYLSEMTQEITKPRSPMRFERTNSSSPLRSERTRPRSKSFGRVAISELTSGSALTTGSAESSGGSSGVLFDKKIRHGSRPVKEWAYFGKDVELKRVPGWKTEIPGGEDSASWAHSNVEKGGGVSSGIIPQTLPLKSGSEHWDDIALVRNPSLDESFKQAVPFQENPAFKAEFDDFGAMDVSDDGSVPRTRSHKSTTSQVVRSPRRKEANNNAWDDDDSDLNTDAFLRYAGDDNDSIFSDLKTVDDAVKSEVALAKVDDVSKLSLGSSYHSKPRKARVSVSTYTRDARSTISRMSRGDMTAYTDAHSVVDEPYACMDRWLD